MNQFIVTSQGLAATRWLCYVLAAHGDVYVAHGRHALESIVSEGKKVSDRKSGSSSYDSLTLGIQLISFYETKILAEIFTAYKTAMPSAKAHGCVHSFPLRTLIDKATSSSENLTNNFKIVNLVRHPISYIESHFGLVKVARFHHLPIHQHYSETMFQDALNRYPELHLIEVSNTDDFVDFTVSCLSCINQLQDFRYSSFSSIPMERITSDVGELREVCQYLTGLDFSDTNLEGLVQESSINSHRQSPISDPLEIYASWNIWKQDIVQMLFNKSLLDSFSQIGYDLSMFGRYQKSNFNLSDRLKTRLDNPELFWQLEKKIDIIESEVEVVNFKYTDILLKLKETEARFNRYVPYPDPILIEEFHEYNIVALKSYYVAVSKSLGAVDLMKVDLEKIEEILVDISVEKLKKRIIMDRTLSILLENELNIPYPDPILIEEFHEYNIVALKSYYVAVSKSLGAIDLMKVDLEKIEEILVDISVEKLKKRIIMDRTPSILVDDELALYDRIVDYWRRSQSIFKTTLKQGIKRIFSSLR